MVKTSPHFPFFKTLLFSLVLFYFANAMTVRSSVGIVQIKNAQSNTWTSLQTGDSFSPGDKLRLGHRSEITLRSQDGIVIRLHDLSIISFESKDESNNISMFLENGRGRFTFDENQSPHFILRSRFASLEKTGTDFLFEQSRRSAEVHVLKGKVKLMDQEGSTEAVSVEAGFSSSIRPGQKALAPTPLDQKILTDWNIPVSQMGYQHEDLILSEPASPDNIITQSSNSSNTAPLSQNSNQQVGSPELAQEEEEVEEEKEREPWEFSMENNLSFGYFKEPGDGYSMKILDYSKENFPHWITLTLMPEFYYGPIGVGLYLPFYLGVRDQFYKRENWYNKDEYDFNESEDYINKFVFIEAKIWRIAFRFGSFPNFSFGSGFLLNDFSNMQEFPTVRKLGLLLGYEDPQNIYSLNYFLGDIDEPILSGLRLGIRPFNLRKNPSEALEKFEIGVNYVQEDLSVSLNAYTNIDSPSLSSNIDFKNNNVRGFGIDAIYPLGPLLSYINYGQLTYATNDNGDSVDFGPGFSLGAQAEFGALGFISEAYYNLNGFQSGYFDGFSYFEQLRAKRADALFAQRENDNLGYLLRFSLALGEAFTTFAEFKQIYDVESKAKLNNRAQAEVALAEGVLDKVHGRAYYIKENISSLDDLTSDALIDALAGADFQYKLAGPFSLKANISLILDENNEPQWSYTTELVFNAGDMVPDFLKDRE